MCTETIDIAYKDYLFDSFYKAYSYNRPLSKRDKAMLWRLVGLCCDYSYDICLDPSAVKDKLIEAARTGKMVRIVPDRQFWKNGECHGQRDGWSYHLVLYFPSNTINGVRFRKNHRGDRIWWVDNPDVVGRWEFSFDRKKIYNMYRDYPHNLTEEEKILFDKENPYWKKHFTER